MSQSRITKPFIFNLSEMGGAIQPEEFQEIVHLISRIPDWKIEAKNEVVLSYLTPTGVPGTLELAQLSEGDSSQRGAHPCLIMTIHSGDRASFGFIRSILSSLPFRKSWMTYSEHHACYLSRSLDIFPAELARWDERVPKLLELYGETVAFYTDTELVFTRNSLGEIGLVNPFLLDFALSQNVDKLDSRELIFTVAKNVSEFCSLYDFQAIPFDFYQFYRKPLRILNYSHINLDNPGRKVFIKPFIYFLGEDGRYGLTKDERALTAMDKIRRGESLDKALVRILSDDLGIAKDFDRAVVYKRLEFDLDREGQITPRLLVNIFIKNIGDNKYAERISRTGWRSKDGLPPRRLQHEK